ncbi:hypothetical protein ACIP9H_40500 [Streptomyces sp. NPDC088732]|uniref:hypothetical protein n=1 Tax=Streptomyces sp. NPDC088732 TaxID=3365879 RepID=UPI0037FAB2AF
MPFDLGDTVRLEAECHNAGGVATTAATATLTVTLPDGTTTTLAVPAPGAAGQYRVDYVPEQPGRHAVRWVWTDPACAYTDAFDVREQTPPMILSLRDMKNHLRITSTSTDDELRGWIESVTEDIEGFAGVCVRRTFTERIDVPAHGSTTLMLRKPPVLSLTSLVAIRSGGPAYDPSEFDVDSSGVIERLDGGRIYGPLRAVYVAGRTIIPPTIRDASKLIVQHLWRTKYGGSRATAGAGEDFLVTEPTGGFGYAIPNRALQLLEPHRLPPGMA